MIEIEKDFLTIQQHCELTRNIYQICDSSCNKILSESKFYMICDQKRTILNHIRAYEGFSYYLKQVMKPSYNVIIHNIMFLESNEHGIKKHINSTLHDILVKKGFNEIAKKHPVPDLQTVYYTGVPADLTGGKLTIYDDKPEVITPEDNKLVCFSGGLPHEVGPFETSGKRVTLFTEQYKMELKDMLSTREAFLDDGTMYEIDRVEHSTESDVSDGEFLMPYDE